MHKVCGEITQWFILAALTLVAFTGLCAMTNISASGTVYFYPRSHMEYCLIGATSLVLSVYFHWSAPSWKAVLGSNLGLMCAWFAMTLVVPWLHLGDITLMLVSMSNAAIASWIVFLSRRAYLASVMRARV